MGSRQMAQSCSPSLSSSSPSTSSYFVGSVRGSAAAPRLLKSSGGVDGAEAEEGGVPEEGAVLAIEDSLSCQSSRDSRMASSVAVSSQSGSSSSTGGAGGGDDGHHEPAGMALVRVVESCRVKSWLGCPCTLPSKAEAIGGKISGPVSL